MAKNVQRRLAAALALLCLCTGCTPLGQGGENTSIAQNKFDEEDDIQTPGEEAISGLSLLVEAEGTAQSLDPIFCANYLEYALVNHLFQGLYAHRQDEGLIPAAAEGYAFTLETDGSATYSFMLRQDALWSDGVQVTAGDFEYAWKRLAQTLPGSGDCGLLEGIQGAEQIRLGELPASALAVNALNDYTLAVTLLGQDDTFLLRTAQPGLFPVRQDAVERAEYDWSLGDAFFCGNGAYTLTGRDDTQLTLRSVEEEPTGPAQIAFMLGDGEATNAQTPHLRLSLGGVGSVMQTGWQYGLQATKADIGEAQTTALLNALALALDDEALAATTRHTAPVGEDTRGFDPAAATEALAGAGYPEGAGWPEGAILLLPEGELHEALGEAITAAWGQVLGITVQHRSEEPQDLNAHPFIFRLEFSHYSTAAQNAVPILAGQVYCAADSGLTGLSFTREGGLYLGNCQLG